MNITVNGIPYNVSSRMLDDVLDELGYTDRRVATAVNSQFIASGTRKSIALIEGDTLEIVAPRQGG